MTADDLFYKMCQLTTKDKEYYKPYNSNIYSIKNLAEEMKQSKYMVRKKMKELEATGLVYKTYKGGQDDDWCVYCYHGWSITEKAAQTKLYKQLEEKTIQEHKGFLNRCYDEVLYDESKGDWIGVNNSKC